MKCLEQNFKKFAQKGLLYRENFEDILLEEVLELVTKKAYAVTEQRWQDLSKIGVPDEFWTATYGPDCERICFEELLKVFERQGVEGKSEVEKLMDLCSEDEALRNQIVDLEQSLQSSQDMLAATDILLEEQTEKVTIQEQEIFQSKKEIEHLQKQLKELEIIRTRVKNMESEHRLVKRDFDLVFATNKSVQKKMEKVDLENRALRKTIIALANQMEKLEREHQGDQTEGLQTNIKYDSNATPAPRINEGARTHLVWDPSVQGLVPIIDPEQMNLNNNNNNNNNHNHNNNYSGGGKKNSYKKHRNHHHHHHHHHHHKGHHHHNHHHNNNHNNNNHNHNNHHHGGGNNHKSHNSGRLVSPFPRRYTSSHIPRYRRKYEMNEIRKIRQNNAMINSGDNGVKI
jgi:hypothetical protein